MTSPVINTTLYTTVAISPSQLNNDIYLNLKNNLKIKILKKCNKYGYVDKIFEILSYTDGRLVAEDFTASVIFNVAYSGRLFNPAEQSEIIVQIEQINKVLILAQNGPIVAIITMDRINTNNFFIDNNGQLRSKSTTKTGTVSKVINQKDFIKITVVAKKFNLGDDKISIIGHVENVATEEEIKAFYNDLYASEKNGEEFEHEDATNADIYKGQQETSAEKDGDVYNDLGMPADPKHPIPTEKLRDEPIEPLAYDQAGYESVDMAGGIKKKKKATPKKTHKKKVRTV
jgi:DNA-directed RNA polymerase subunit E'/Rpb7